MKRFETENEFVSANKRSNEKKKVEKSESEGKCMKNINYCKRADNAAYEREILKLVADYHSGSVNKEACKSDYLNAVWQYCTSKTNGERYLEYGVEVMTVAETCLKRFDGSRPFMNYLNYSISKATQIPEYVRDLYVKSKSKKSENEVTAEESPSLGADFEEFTEESAIETSDNAYSSGADYTDKYHESYDSYEGADDATDFGESARFDINNIGDKYLKNNKQYTRAVVYASETTNRFGGNVFDYIEDSDYLTEIDSEIDAYAELKRIDRIFRMQQNRSKDYLSMFLTNALFKMGKDYDFISRFTFCNPEIYDMCCENGEALNDCEIAAMVNMSPTNYNRAIKNFRTKLYDDGPFKAA